MRTIIKSKISLIIAIIGFIGGIVWCNQTNYNIEALILTAMSLIEILAFFLVPEKEDDRVSLQNKNEQNVNVNVNIGKPENIDNKITENIEKPNRAHVIDCMLTRSSILFIDDDKNFNVVKILKDSGWRKTKTTTDIKTLDLLAVKEADIIFVDINGVGKLLNLEFEGLDLALMLKQKYPEKKIVIYSANRNSNSFHKAWDICDFKLEKNALPYQFQNLVEEYSIEIYNNKK